MKHKISELEDANLDAAVARCDGVALIRRNRDVIERMSLNDVYADYYKPSKDWRIAGPIIDRERIILKPLAATRGGKLVEWFATIEYADDRADEDGCFTDEHGVECVAEYPAVGPTPLIAAMRSFVSSKFGDEIDLP